MQVLWPHLPSIAVAVTIAAHTPLLLPLRSRWLHFKDHTKQWLMGWDPDIPPDYSGSSRGSAPAAAGVSEVPHSSGLLWSSGAGTSRGSPYPEGWAKKNACAPQARAHSYLEQRAGKPHVCAKLHVHRAACAHPEGCAGRLCVHAHP
jgi:hypothetical protein